MKAKRCGTPRGLIAGIEALAKRVRADVVRATRNRGLIGNFEMARLRKEGLRIAELIEQYVHALRMELMRPATATRRTKRMKRAA